MKNWVTVTGDHHRVEIMAPMCFPPPKMVINMCHTYMLIIQIFCFRPNTQNGGHLEFLKLLIIKDSLNKFEKKIHFCACLIMLNNIHTNYFTFKPYFKMSKFKLLRSDQANFGATEVPFAIIFFKIFLLLCYLYV